MKAFLPKVPTPALAKVDAPGVAAMGAGQAGAQTVGRRRALGPFRRRRHAFQRRYQDQMHVVQHQALGPAGDARSRAGLGQQLEIGPVVGLLEEGFHSPDAALRHMMRLARNHHSGHPCHPTSLGESRRRIKKPATVPGIFPGI